MTAPLTDEDMAAIMARADAATAGPWRLNDKALCPVDWGESTHMTDVAIAWRNDERDDEDYDQIVSDLVFCAAARTDVPTLRAEITRLRAEAEAANASAATYKAWYEQAKLAAERHALRRLERHNELAHLHRVSERKSKAIKALRADRDACWRWEIQSQRARAAAAESALAEARRDGDRVYRLLSRTHAALSAYVHEFAGIHDGGCPEDDTCDCALVCEVNAVMRSVVDLFCEKSAPRAGGERGA